MSNLKLKSGIAPILDLHRAGVEIALSCVNYCWAETQNILIAMRMLCLLPTVTNRELHSVHAAYALKATTVIGARAVGPWKQNRRVEARHECRHEALAVWRERHRLIADGLARRKISEAHPTRPPPVE